MKVLDIHGAPVFQVNLSDDSGITSMSWSCEKFCMNENKIKSDREYIKLNVFLKKIVNSFLFNTWM